MDMLYMIGGAPRTGKTILAQRIAAKLNVGWVSTDVLSAMLRLKDKVKPKWDATPKAVANSAEWFLPYLERFIRGVTYLSDCYIIEGVAFLPAQVMQLSGQFQIQSVFLGCSIMTLDRFDQFPGHSRGYASLPKDVRLKIVDDVPLWSSFIEQETNRFGYPFIDMVDDFPSCLDRAETMLITGK
jgi:hypothetical protein